MGSAVSLCSLFVERAVMPMSTKRFESYVV